MQASSAVPLLPGFSLFRETVLESSVICAVVCPPGMGHTLGPLWPSPPGSRIQFKGSVGGLALYLLWGSSQGEATVDSTVAGPSLTATTAS